jgi:hypothetical protein
MARKGRRGAATKVLRNTVLRNTTAARAAHGSAGGSYPPVNISAGLFRRARTESAWAGAKILVQLQSAILVPSEASVELASG